jgi:hypothetical protein
MGLSTEPKRKHMSSLGIAGIVGVRTALLLKIAGPFQNSFFLEGNVRNIMPQGLLRTVVVYGSSNNVDIF